MAISREGRTILQDLHVAIRQAFKQAVPLRFPRTQVESLLRGDSTTDDLFRQALRNGLATIPKTQRSGLNAYTGAIAEALVESLLVEEGWYPAFHQATMASGGHGLDLAMLDPSAQRVFSVEVKGSVAPTGRPRLSRGQVDQMTHEWMWKQDNPAIQELGLSAGHLDGMVAFVHFPSLSWRVVVIDARGRVSGVTENGQLADVAWSDPRGQTRKGS